MSSWKHDRLWGRHPAVTSGDDRSLGQKSADGMKRALACWPALLVVCIVIVGWMVSNGAGTDAKPWILLNLCLSCFAALQCFILLIANKRGEQIAAELAQHTYELAIEHKRLIEENTTLTAQVKVNTDLLHEVHEHVTAIGLKVGAAAGHFEP